MGALLGLILLVVWFVLLINFFWPVVILTVICLVVGRLRRIHNERVDQHCRNLVPDELMRQELMRQHYNRIYDESRGGWQ